MPTFIAGKKRNPWKGQVKRKGYGQEAAYFPTEDEAKKWEDGRRATFDKRARGELVSDPNDLRQVTIGDMIDKYLEKVTSKKATAEDEVYRLEMFRNWRDIANRPVIAFTRHDAIEFTEYLEHEYKYVRKPYIITKGRLKGKSITPKSDPKSIKASSVIRITATFKHMWNVAASKWRGYESLEERNPWKAVNTDKVSRRKRKRRLDDRPDRHNELERILDACARLRGDNFVFIPLAINLAIQTGMRQQEILNLRWSDIDRKNKTIDIRKSKTDFKSEDDGRLIAMPLRSFMCLIAHNAIKYHNDEDIWKSDKRIFPMTDDAFKQSWKRVTAWAGIPSKDEDRARGIRESQCGLEFKDLRREAGSRFDEAGLTKLEHDLMLGHDNPEMRSIYVASHLNAIRRKLDDYWKEPQFDGPTTVPDIFQTIIDNGERTGNYLKTEFGWVFKLVPITLKDGRKELAVHPCTQDEYEKGIAEQKEKTTDLPANVVQLFKSVGE